MKILMYKWKAYNHIDVEGNLLLRGHDIDIIEEVLDNVEENPEFEKKLKKMLDKSNYDIFFSINYFPVISDICEARSLPYVYWTCDSQITCMYHESIFNSCNIGFLFDYADFVTFENMGANVHYLPLAGATDRIRNLLSNSNDLDIFKSEVSFIGSMYNKNMYDKTREHLTDYLKGYFDCSLNIQQDLYTKNIFPDILNPDTVFELLKVISKNPSKRNLSSESQVFSTAVLGFKTAQLERKARLTSISKKCKLDVYTDDETAEFGLASNRGEVNYWQDAPKVFNQSKININLTIKNIRTGIPLRVFDVLSSNGFLITNFQTEMPLYFEKDVDLVWFTCAEEFEEKVVYYLKNEDKRKKIAQRGAQLVHKNHNYQIRFDDMAKIVSKI